MPPKRQTAKGRVDIIRSITTPLGFYVLALLIVEATLATVLTCSNLSEEHKWDGFKIMVAVFLFVILVVTVFAWKNPKNLLYGKEEYAIPPLDPAALGDQIEEMIAKRVKGDCLK